MAGSDTRSSLDGQRIKMSGSSGVVARSVHRSTARERCSDGLGRAVQTDSRHRLDAGRSAATVSVSLASYRFTGGRDRCGGRRRYAGADGRVRIEAQVLFQELRRRQYEGSYETVKRFGSAVAGDAAARGGDARMWFEMPPRLQSQIDWDQAWGA